jgi:Protein of unknown function (DUF3102)
MPITEGPLAPTQTSPQSNRLTVLAAEIRKAHADVQDAAKMAAQRAIEAGHALIEAKELVQQGGWLPWLRENCALAERTAQLYMKIAKSGLESATVADLGLQGAAEAVIFHVDLWSELSQPENVEWRVFTLFLARECGWHIEGAIAHIEWLRRGGVRTVSQWFGECGEQFGRRFGFLDVVPIHAAWGSFFEAHRGLTLDQCSAEIDRTYAEQGPLPDGPPPRRRRRRRRIPKSDPRLAAALRCAAVGARHDRN